MQSEILSSKAGYLYSIFKASYEKRIPIIHDLLNYYSTGLIREINYMNIVNSPASVLKKRIKECLISYLNSISLHYYSHYCNAFNLRKPNQINAVEQLFESIDYFVSKFVSDLKNDLDTELLTTKNVIDSITNILPPSDDKGKYQGRLKTMFYMLGIALINKIASQINNFNNLNSMIIDLKGGATNNLEMNNDIFKIRTKQSLPLWKSINGWKSGANVPSQFGSQEIIVPIT